MQWIAGVSLPEDDSREDFICGSSLRDEGHDLMIP